MCPGVYGMQEKKRMCEQSCVRTPNTSPHIHAPLLFISRKRMLRYSYVHTIISNTS